MLYLYYVSCVALSECVPASVWCPVVLEYFVCGLFWCFMHMYWWLYAWAIHTWLEACWCFVAGLAVGVVVSGCRLNHYWPVHCGPRGFRGLWPLGTRGLYRLGSAREWVFYCGGGLGYGIVHMAKVSFSLFMCLSRVIVLSIGPYSCRKLLKMDVLTSETCLAAKWHNKASVIKLVYLYTNIKMMHGPIRIRLFKCGFSWHFYRTLKRLEKYRTKILMFCWPCISVYLS